MPHDRLTWLEACKPAVIGMIHLPPLAGSPGYAGDRSAIEKSALADAEALVSGRISALMLENFGDAPFYPGRVPAETIAQMTALAAIIRSATDLPLGINVLRNDGRSALAIALAVNAAFVRVNILSGARVTDQGIIEGISQDLLRDRARLAAEEIAILADVDVKHSAPLAEVPLEQEVSDLIERAGADGVIVSGRGTGHKTSPGDVERVRSLAGSVPVFVGSGVTKDNLQEFLPAASGFIVGTAFKDPDRPGRPIDPARVQEFMGRLREVSGSAL